MSIFPTNRLKMWYTGGVPKLKGVKVWTKDVEMKF